ncbi:Single-stranded DNA-binding protein [Richelia intracellularis HH01]|uniref:Single-stranded DNA-binding protein n=1 Tax=Richelia intracellularis HH01 TaxID=1165094 RepID=M1WZ90_9NOST|nr:single-stranded DNA-binding protein [Richelia intracellularis]CCH67382.1 Single-stranded DNA-binding protein [Richelia intracellularis HH01]HAE06391.1 single-stranded DNA-binding protein [Richelia sp.]
MNSCILLVDIIQEPQLRYTSDNLEVTEMLVQFPGIRENDPPATLKVVSWGKLAREIQQNYHLGDHTIIEGRLSINTIERREGFKEKRAELTIQKIHSFGNMVNTLSSSSISSLSDSSKGNEHNSPLPIPTSVVDGMTTSNYQDWNQPLSTNTPLQSYSAPTTKEESDMDDIPFLRPIYSFSTWSHEIFDLVDLEINDYCQGIEKFKP